MITKHLIGIFPPFIDNYKNKTGIYLILCLKTVIIGMYTIIKSTSYLKRVSNGPILTAAWARIYSKSHSVLHPYTLAMNNISHIINVIHC